MRVCGPSARDWISSRVCSRSTAEECIKEVEVVKEVEELEERWMRAKGAVDVAELQFEIWTGRSAPEGVMTGVLLNSTLGS